MIKHLLVFILFFWTQQVFAVAEIIVKPGTISFGGYSNIDEDQSNIYAGVAGNVAGCTVDGISPCNTCALSTGVADGCNQVSIYPTLKFSVSFKVTKSVSNAVAKIFLDTTQVGSLAGANYTADTSTVTIETTWDEICNALGAAGCTSAASFAASKSIKFGVDSDASGEVDDAEKKSITLKFHYLKQNDLGVVQAYCPDTNVPTGPGICNLGFIPGDEKAYIDTAGFGGADTTSTSTGTSIDWESIAIFPVAVSAGLEAAVYAGFQTNLVEPIFNKIETDGTIPDSQVTGGMSNYQKYCLVYGTKNKAQNIYKFVTTGVNTATSCVTPSEVVGILEDKHCFISTAAFGSDMAPEVETFRQFRNRFLLSNAPGREFVKAYYRFGPSVAEIIAQNEFLRTLSRGLLYPLLLLSQLSLAMGFGWALLISLAITVLLAVLARGLRKKRNSAVLLLFLLLAPNLRAEVSSGHDLISHEGSKEGLIKITKDGTYIYDTKRELGSESSKITFGQANNPEITIEIEGTDSQGVPNGTFTPFTFEDFYSEASGLIVGYDYEKFPWIDKGKLGYQLGVGLMFASGNGRLVATPNGPSVESFTFLTLPINVGGVYRFEWKDKQLLAPYVCGGGTYVVLMEKREDIATPQVTGGFGFYGAGGLLLNIAAIDDEAGYALESEYGINALWLTMEFRVTEVNSESFSYSNAYVNAGLSFDF